MSNKNLVKLIAFYLPQFHPIPENDEWWGRGFTEWTNVAKARPLFEGHHQPQLPADLGFYDLRLPEVRKAQADLARAYGIQGFCYYHYWFNGRMLLERPFDEVQASGEPDFPFCLCWANENWTSRWDGRDVDILMRQSYEEYDPLAHIAWLEKAFSDRRYIRIDGKPLFSIYCADQIPDIKAVVSCWRGYLSARGYPGIYLCAVNSHRFSWSEEESVANGFDALIGFQPHYRSFPPSRDTKMDNVIAKKFNRILSMLCLEGIVSKRTTYSAYRYQDVLENAVKLSSSGNRLFPCVFPSWDNSPRKRLDATIIQNSDANMFKRWLGEAMKMVADYPPDERLVFVNAWNEWAEGCHLEPDMKNGLSFLTAVKEALATHELANK